jgi:RNA polymerase primary sigma factor
MPTAHPTPRAARWLARHPADSAWDLTDRRKAAKARDAAKDKLHQIDPARYPLDRWLATDRPPLLTADDEADLAARSAAGDLAARNALVLANVGLVYKITARWAISAEHTRELRQEAMLALIKAADAYDPARGRFTTWAWHKVEWCLSRTYAADRLIALPPEMLRKLAALNREWDADYLARHPAARDLAAELGWTPAALDRARQIPQAVPIDPAPPADDDRRPDLGILAAAEAADRAEAAADRAESAADRAEAAADGLDRMTPNERKVMLCWAAEPGRHAADVARELGMSETQVYGYRRRAKERLRANNVLAA